MKFYEYGDKNQPNVMLIHGAGWSYWLYLRQAKMLQNRYHIILPVIDGHGEEFDIPYISTEETATEILRYIDENCDGKLFAISGVSLGGQIVIELLSRRKDIAKKAIIESGLCIPQDFLMKYSIFMIKIFGNLLFSKSFNKFALKLLPRRMKIPDESVDLYLRDITSIKRSSLIQVLKTYYSYHLKNSLKDCEADTQYWFGGKEMKCIKESSKLFKTYLQECDIIEFKNYYHAEISTYHSDEWVEFALKFFNK